MRAQANLLWLAALSLTGAALLFCAGGVPTRAGQAFKPAMPKIWDDAAIAALQVPLAGATDDGAWKESSAKLVAGSQVPHAPPPGMARRAQLAVETTLPLLQRSARTWYQKIPCGSCHHQGLGILVVAVARERGFAIDRAMLAEQVAKTRDGLGAPADYIIGNPSINEQIGQSYRLVALAAGGLRPGRGTALVGHMLAGKQHVNGHWNSYSHRPPLEDSQFTATAITIRALRLFTPPSLRGETEARIQRARWWLARAVPRSTEEEIMQLLGLSWAGAENHDIAPVKNRLLREQRPDGGWAQIATRESDAYATGQVLVALNQAGGLPVEDPAYLRGVAFLLKTQKSDGSWLVETRRTRSPGLPYFETGFPHGKHQFISYAATAWATMALALSENQAVSAVLMGEPRSAGEPEVSPAGNGGIQTTDRNNRSGDSNRHETARAGNELNRSAASQDDLTSLMRAALGGTSQGLQKLLAEGADVNAVATSEGITPLMCAVHNPAKTALVVSAGADVNAATKSGYTALMIAAGYDGAAESVKLLLEHGANVNAHSTDLLNGVYSPVQSAARRGDLELISMLLARGAKLNDLPAGSSALVFAVAQGDAPTAAFLLDRGAKVDTRIPQFGGATLLMLAADAGFPDVVKVLLKKGAVINARDDEGLTPLMYAAAAIDRGDTEIVETLLAGGADTGVRTAAGESALSLAEKYGNSRAAAILREAASSSKGPGQGQLRP